MNAIHVVEFETITYPVAAVALTSVDITIVMVTDDITAIAYATVAEVSIIEIVSTMIDTMTIDIPSIKATMIDTMTKEMSRIEIVATKTAITVFVAMGAFTTEIDFVMTELMFV